MKAQSDGLSQLRVLRSSRPLLTGILWTAVMKADRASTISAEAIEGGCEEGREACSQNLNRRALSAKVS